MVRRWLLIAVAGCSGEAVDDKSTGDTDPSDTDTDTDADSDADTDTDTDTGTAVDATASLSGTVTDAGGPVAAGQIRFCKGTACRNAETAADGTYTIEQVQATWYSFEVVPGPGQVTAFVPLVFETDEARTVDIVMQDAVSTRIPDPAAALDVAAGLRLTIGAGALEEVPLQDPATHVLAARVPPSDWVPTDGVTGTVLGQWYVGPFDFPSVDPAGLPLRFENTFGLADGTVLRAYVGSYVTSEWVDLGSTTVEAGGWTTPVGLPLLSTVLLVQE